MGSNTFCGQYRPAGSGLMPSNSSNRWSKPGIRCDTLLFSVAVTTVSVGGAMTFATSSLRPRARKISKVGNVRMRALG